MHEYIIEKANKHTNRQANKQPQDRPLSTLSKACVLSCLTSHVFCSVAGFKTTNDIFPILMLLLPYFEDQWCKAVAQWTH